MAYFADDWRLFRHSFTVNYFQHTCTYWRTQEWISRRSDVECAVSSRWSSPGCNGLRRKNV